MAEERDLETGIVTRPRSKTARKLQKPPLYRVLLHNDDYTTREFVVDVLRTVFHRDEPEAVQIMLHVHQNGTGVAGVYTFEDGESAGSSFFAAGKGFEEARQAEVWPASESRSEG